MIRTLQVLRSVARVGLARARGAYDWKFEIAQQCQELGGVYIKFLQMLAVHKSTQYLVEGMGAELAFEQVPYEEIDLEAELGPLGSQFSKIEPTAFAAGSYGQVYMAWLKSGEQVIVKVLRPSVRRTLRTDLRLLTLIGTITSLFTGASMVNFRMMAKEFARATWLETNYQLEAQNGERIRAYFDERKTLIIPRSFPELTSRTVLVQEYVGGVSVVALEAKQREGMQIDQLVRRALGSDVWKQLRTLGTELLHATVYADYLMVDPHPGNVRLLPDDKVALIDFGLVSPAPTNRGAFATLIHEMRKLYEDDFEAGNFAVAMLAFFDTELHDALERVAQDQSEDYAFSLGGFIDKFVANQSKQTEIQHYISDKQLLQLFSNILNQDNKLGIRITEENALLQRSMTMFMSVIRAISDAHSERVYEPIIHDCLVLISDIG
jgi:predicted unusual protein kinase regulating ubiquinone biosynthesis (AarF/ABC1/UbiB family)